MTIHTATTDRPIPNLRINDRISFAITTDSPKTFRTARVLCIKPSEIIAAEETEEKAIVRLEWSEVLPPY